MKKMLLILLLFPFSMLFAQAPITLGWSENYGGSNTDFSKKAIPTSDGGFILFGNTSSTNEDFTGNDGGSDIFALKIDANANVLWSKTYGGNGIENLGDAVLLNDGTVMIVGSSSSNNGDVAGNYGISDIWLLQIDATGNILWNQNYGTNEVDNGHTILPTDDGGFVIVGENRNDIDYTRDGYVLKIDATKNVEWESFFGGTSNDHLTGIQQKANGNYLISGHTYSNNGDISDFKGNVDGWLIEVDTEGDLVWSKTYGGTQFDHINAVYQNTAGDFMIAGYTISTDFDITDNDGNFDAWIMKLTPTGTVLWSKTYGGSELEVAYSITELPGNGYMVAGSSESNSGDLNGNFGGKDFWLFQINENGNLIWQSNYGGSADDEAKFIVIQNQTVLVCGNSSSNDNQIENYGDSDIWVLKFSLEDLAVTEWTQNEISIYPNPVQENLYINSMYNIESYTLYDLNGRKIKSETVNVTNPVLNLDELMSGFYIIEIRSGNVVKSVKIHKK